MLGDHPIEVTLLATDLASSRTFYAEKLGLNIERETENAVTSRCAGESCVTVSASTTGTADEQTQAASWRDTEARRRVRGLTAAAPRGRSSCASGIVRVTERRRMFFVTGATGNAGGAVVQALVRNGHQVTALVRGGREAGLPAGVEPVVGDLNDPRTFADALDGVSGIFLLSGYDRISELLAEMHRAKVERIVLLSSSAAPGGDLTNAVARYHILTERAVRESGVPWTFLQPNSFMTNTLQWIPQVRQGDVIRAPFGDVPIATIDPDDIAAVAVKALETDEFEERSLRLSGPEALYPADRVRFLGSALGRQLQFEAQSNEEARAEMSAAMPAEYVDAFFSFFVDGTTDETRVLPTVAEVLGREPRSFEQWLNAHRAAFR
jgi:uncharacterized protein YbjT (DUF2867 family)